MSDKQLVIEAIRDLPESMSLEKISEEIAILAAIKRGEADADNGRVVTSAEMRKRVASWTSK